MKKRRAVWVAVATLTLVVAFDPGSSSRAEILQPAHATAAVPASVPELSPIDPEAVPVVGTFYLLSDYLVTESPPAYPFCPPLVSGTAVYALDAEGVFLVDDTASAIGILQQSEGMNRGLNVAERSSGLRSALTAELDFPEESDPLGGGAAPSSTCSYSASDLWLEITAVTNQSASFRIHTPETDGVYDLFATTNLGGSESGLNAITWTPVLRSDPGQTDLMISNLTSSECFFILAKTNDTDGDGITDGFETLVSHTDPNNIDQNANGIPDGWEWAHFGSLQPGDADYDGDLVSNYSEYLRGSDPNTIRAFISLTNQYVNGPARLQLNVEAGVPASCAVLVDNTNLAAATWVPYWASNLTVNLGSVEGWHQVRVGLRGRTTASEQTWLRRRIKLDLTPPSLAVTNPTATTVSQPMIQLKGFSSEPLQSITCDLTNASGAITNHLVLVLDQFCDTNLWEVTTNYFQAFDLALANGVNCITLRACDLAGNTTVTNFSFTLDYSDDTMPPAIKLCWPREGMRISGSNITWRGFVDDPTATVAASVTGTNGVTNSITAIVERDGKFWAEELPLIDGTNTLTLTATDAAGNMSITNISIINLPGVLTIHPVAEGQLTNSTLDWVSGTITLNYFTVWVNGVRAASSGGTWSAANVPFEPGGTANIHATAIPNSDNGGAGTGGSGSGPAGDGSGGFSNPDSAGGIEADLNPDLTGSFVYLGTYVGQLTAKSSSADECGDGVVNWNETTDYRSPVDSDDCGGGSFQFDEKYEVCGSGTWSDAYRYHYAWPRNGGLVTLFIHSEYSKPWTNDAGSSTQEVTGKDALADILPLPLRYQDRGLIPSQWQENGGESGPGYSYSYNRSIISRVKLWTGGKNVAGRKSTFRLSANATGWRLVTVPDPNFPYNDWMGDNVVATLPLGMPGSDGKIYAQLPGGISVNVTPKVDGVDTYEYDVTAKKICVEVTDLVVSAGRLIAGSCPPIYVVRPCAGEVIVTAIPDRPVPEELIDWTFNGGEPVGLGKLQRKVDSSSLVGGSRTFYVVACSTTALLEVRTDPHPITPWMVFPHPDKIECLPGQTEPCRIHQEIDSCGNRLELWCDRREPSSPAAFHFKHNDKIVGTCKYTNAVNYWYYRLTGDGRFHSTWHLSREDTENNPHLMEGSPNKYDWVVWTYDCIDGGDEPEHNCRENETWDEEYGGTGWGDPNNDLNGATVGTTSACE
jgi:hypothetical protein